jgi:triosephosphate isomerase
MNKAPVIAGNWKMNLNPQEVRGFFQAFAPPAADAPSPEILVFPPSVSLAAALEARPSSPPVGVGVQNIHWEQAGAFTGEVSAPLAKASGATHALIGHSERRHVFGETDEEVALKTRAAMDSGLIPVICVGETLEERRSDRLAEVILRQLMAVMPVLAENPEIPALLAYEPVWAIGTGETATPDDASQAHQILRERLKDELGEVRAEAVPILYGGSVKPANVRELLDAPEVDGVLVGGASLDPASFSLLVEAGGKAIGGR